MAIMKRLFLEIIYAILLFIGIDILPIDFKWVFICFAALFILTVWINIKNRLAMTLSILMAMLLINFILPNFMDKTYYRPYEILKKEIMPGFKRYTPNQTSLVENSHGDLMAVGFSHPEAPQIQENRRQSYNIDANGYRNSGRSEGIFALLLIGDSFVEGIGVDDVDTLTMQLQKKGIDAYNIGHNGDISEYFESLRYAKENFKIDGPAFLFAFEGNDFASRNYCVKEKSALAGIRDSHRALKELHLSRFLAAIFARISMSSQKPTIQITEAAGKKIGFLQEYIDAASAPEYNDECLRSLFTRNKSMINAIFFIPEKSRVYHSLLPQYEQLKKPSIYAASLEKIAKELNLPFVDLTIPLQKAAQANLREGKFIFWRDDTHWNKLGIAVAADEAQKVFERIKK